LHNTFSVLTCEETEPTIDWDIDSKKGNNKSETKNEAAVCPTQIQILQRPKGADHSKGKGKLGSAERPIVCREVGSAEQSVVSETPKENVGSAEQSVKPKRNSRKMWMNIVNPWSVEWIKQVADEGDTKRTLQHL